MIDSIRNFEPSLLTPLPTTCSLKHHIKKRKVEENGGFEEKEENQTLPLKKAPNFICKSLACGKSLPGETDAYCSICGFDQNKKCKKCNEILIGVFCRFCGEPG
jgi:hypothetical protein